MHIAEMDPYDQSRLVMKVMILTIILVSMVTSICCCRRLCKKRDKAPVVVTSATHTAPGGYPVTQLPPQGYQANVYAAPYPGQQSVTVQMPMPMPANQSTGAVVGMPQSYVPPYPVAQPAATVGGNMSPPSYDMAVAGASAAQTHPSQYEKQAPYNPNY